MIYRFLTSVLLLLWLCGCQPEPPKQESRPRQLAALARPDTSAVQLAAAPLPPPDYDTLAWTELIRLDSTLLFDIRYATEDNFVGKQLYDCPRCFLRPEVAQAVVQANRALQQQGLGLKLFDCYRPLPVQWELWNTVSIPGYVADPHKGSMHNRGSAVDLTIVDAQGRELPMGTAYDFFGPEAHYAYPHLSDSVWQNRQLLRETMVEQGFRPIRTEWWHFSFSGKNYALSDMLWKCYGVPYPGKKAYISPLTKCSLTLPGRNRAGANGHHPILINKQR